MLITADCPIRVGRKPTWGTCAGLILLAESATRTKRGGQELIGGLDVKVNRNHFGRQTESFEAELILPFLSENGGEDGTRPFNGVFIRAPVVEKLLPVVQREQSSEKDFDETVIAPPRSAEAKAPVKQVLQPVEVMATLPGRSRKMIGKIAASGIDEEVGDIVAVKQGNVFGTSFHPELTGDARIHIWWLKEVRDKFQSEHDENHPS